MANNFVFSKKAISYYCLFLCGAYFCFLIFYSLDVIDSSFILSFVMRLQNGQKIYKDFDYVRPFGSILIWDLLLYFTPKNFKYLFLLSRIIVLLEIILISFLIFKIYFNTNKQLIALFFIFILHNFNIMPWHTIDGILISIIGIYFFQRKFYLSTMLFALLAMSIKQSFYIFGATLLCCIVILSSKEKFKLIKTDIRIFLICGTIVCIAIFNLDLLRNFKSMFLQIMGSSDINQFVEVGCKSYFLENTYYNILIIISLLILYIIPVRQKSLFVLFSIAIIYIFSAPLFNGGNYIGIKTMFLYLCVLAIKQRQNLSVLLLFLLAWSCSISWGGNTPVFLIFVLYIILFRDFFTSNYYITTFLIFGLVNFSLIRINYPYFNTSPLKTEYIWIKNENAISGLYINKKTYNYIKEAQTINDKYNNVFFLPGSPLLDVVNNSYISRSSWEMDVEYPNWKMDLQLNANAIFVVDKTPAVKYKSGFFKSSFTTYIEQNKTIVETTENFILYK